MITAPNPARNPSLAPGPTPAPNPEQVVVEHTAGVEPVGLEELNAQAALQTRVDRKYLLGGQDLQDLLVRLAGRTPPVQVLQIGAERAMRYRSMYFDTPDRISFRQSTLRRRRRFKVRTRQYADTGQAFLEIKRSGSRGETVKLRHDHPYESFAAFRGTADDAVASALQSTGVDPRRLEELVPTLITSYRRSTILLPAADPRLPASRVTVDTDLSWTLVDATSPVTLSHPDLAVVEMKSARSAGDVDRMLRWMGRRPARMSKYCTGLAALCPQLPATPWHRTLRRHFADSAGRLGAAAAVDAAGPAVSAELTAAAAAR